MMLSSMKFNLGGGGEHTKSHGAHRGAMRRIIYIYMYINLAAQQS